MAAGINDKFTEATNGSRPVPTTLTALLPSGASPGTATCGALTGWATATAVHFVIYTVDVNGRKVSGSQTDWKGIVSGSTLTGLVLKAGTNNGYAIGAVVEAAPTAAWADDVTEGIRVEHNQDGTHAAVTATSLVASGNSTAASHISTGDAQLRSVSLETIHSHFVFDFVQSGGVWSGDSYGSTRAASMTAAVLYINGRRYSVGSVTARTFTASKDTYIDVDNTGTLVYTEVTNNAASPALAANSVRIGIIVTAAGSIASVASVNQGQEDKIVPIASSAAYSVVDSLGNLICPRDPMRRIIGYRQLFVDATTSSASAVAVAALSCPVIIPTGRKIRITVRTGGFYNGTASARSDLTIWDGTVGSGTLMSLAWGAQALGGGTWGAHGTSRTTPSSSTKTYNVGIHSGSGGGVTTLSTTAAPVYLEIELL